MTVSPKEVHSLLPYVLWAPGPQSVYDVLGPRLFLGPRDDSSGQLERERREPLRAQMRPNNSLPAQALSTHFTEVKTEVWRGKQAAKAKGL